MGVDTRERTQYGNGDGAGTRTEAEIIERTQDGSGDGKEGSSGDRNEN